LNRCQQEFEGPKPTVDESLPSEEREEKLMKIRRRAQGNITFIGELFNKKVISKQITLGVLVMLLGSMSNPPTDPTPENLELANKLLRTSGKTFDAQAKEVVDKLMEGIAALSKNPQLDSRTRFMLLDLIECRQNNWVLREGQASVGPMTIKELHEELRQKDIEKERELEESASLRASGSRQNLTRSSGGGGSQTDLRASGGAPRGAPAKQPAGPSHIPSTAKWGKQAGSTAPAAASAPSPSIAKKSQGDVSFEMGSGPSSPAPRRPMCSYLSCFLSFFFFFPSAIDDRALTTHMNLPSLQLAKRRSRRSPPRMLLPSQLRPLPPRLPLHLRPLHRIHRCQLERRRSLPPRMTWKRKRNPR
jgi:translation initiation factor 4G